MAVGTPVYVTGQSRIHMPTLAGYIDVIPSSSLSRTKKVTQHPLEDGSVISDHVSETPASMRITVYISDIFNTGVTAKGNLLTGEAKQQASWQQIQELYRKSELLSVQTPYETMNNMLIDRYSWSRNSSKGRGLDIELSLTQVRLINRDGTEGSAGIILNEDTGGTQDEDIADRIGNTGGSDTGGGTQSLGEGESELTFNNPRASNLIVNASFDYYGTLGDHDNPASHSLPRVITLSWFPSTSAWYMDIRLPDKRAFIEAHRVVNGIQSIRPAWKKIGTQNLPVIPGRLDARGSGEIGRNSWAGSHKLIYIQDD